MAHSLAAGVVLVSLLLALLEWVGSSGQNPDRKVYGYLTVLLGADGKVSTGKTVVALWSLVLAETLMILSAMVWFTQQSAQESFGGDWDSYFLLLGGPFASAVLAKGVTVSRLADPSAKASTKAASATALPTTRRLDSPPSARDIVSNDAGETDLIDTQYFLFSFVAIVYFVGSVVDNIIEYVEKPNVPGITLPSIPSALLGLTSLAALTYVGNKATQTQGLRTVNIAPPTIHVGDLVTVTLVNLPPTSTTSNTVVVLASESVSIQLAPSRIDLATGQLDFTAPATAGTYELSIVAPGSVTGLVPLPVV